MTEQQPYEVVSSYDHFEVRRYPEHVLAEVVVDGEFEDAGNRAFRSLFAYISGENVSRTKVSMTAPVVQDGPSTKIEMTAPVVQQPGSAAENTHRVGFVLPAGLTEDTAPRPTNSEVHLRTVAESTVAAIRYRGRWTEESYSKHLEELRAAMAAEGLTETGGPRFARFDPPLKPPFLRHNEVLLDVRAV
jgi:hypothetical protein